jgi:N-acetylmuramoyl-L-alanine amidase
MQRIQRSYFFLLLLLATLAPAYLMGMRAEAQMAPAVMPFKTIVIDPGHGGNDAGAKGPAGTTEKEVTLKFANLLVSLLSPSFKVILTRNGDYNVETSLRTAVANHNKADLFISLHTGASFLHASTGMTVYSYQPADKQLATAPITPTDKLPWEKLQIPHMPASRAFARIMLKALESVNRSAPVYIHQAPLAVLQGATMPSILIEIGQLTNPETEQSLASKDQMSAYARVVAGAIETYLTVETATKP